VTIDTDRRTRTIGFGSRSRPYRVGGALITGVALDLAVDPTRTHIPLCPFHAATGLRCPLCGGLRAVYSLAHGDAISALRDNALFVLSLPLVLALWLEWCWRVRNGRPARRVTRAAAVALVIVAVLFTLARNLPVASAPRP